MTDLTPLLDRMIVFVQLKDVGLPRSLTAVLRPPRPDRDHGLLWAVTGQIVTLGHVPPRPRPGRIGLISVWDSEPALDAFLARSKDNEPPAGEYAVRLRPVHTVYGSWAALPELADFHRPTPDGPVAVLTLGRLRLTQTRRFLRASARAEKQLLTAPGLLAAVGVARPPFLSTFSLWLDAGSMRSYAYGPGGHADASAAHIIKPFHHEAIFIRLAPCHSAGIWDGIDPLATKKSLLPSRSL